MGTLFVDDGFTSVLYAYQRRAREGTNADHDEDGGGRTPLDQKAQRDAPPEHPIDPGGVQRATDTEE